MPKTRGSNYIAGTRGDDVIDARARFEDLTIDAKGGNDIVRGGAGNDTIYGGAGNDFIYGSVLDKLIDGGTGNDTVSFIDFSHSSGKGVDVRLVGGTLGIWPDQDGAEMQTTGKIANVENVVGSNYNDALAGNGFVNELDGAGGNDWLLARGSGDFLTGGSGADKFSLDEAGRTVTITDFEFSSGDRLFLTIGTQISWEQGSATDADGVVHSAWIGSYLDWSGLREQVFLLDVTETPTADWLISLA